MSSWDLFIYLDIGLHLVKNSCRILWRMSIKSNRINTNDVDAVVSYWLFDCIDKGRCSQSAQREFHPRFVRHFATRLVDNFCLF